MWKPFVRLVALVAVLAMASLSAACGSSDSSDDSRPSSQQKTPTTSASSPSGATPTTTDAVASFCDHIAPAGNGPADAFMAIMLTDPDTAHSTAVDEQKLMKGAVPPAEIAEDWKTWQEYVAAVVQASSDGGSLASVANLEQKSRGAQQRLTDYAFAHCA